MENFLLQEDGSNLLLEDGSNILLEQSQAQSWGWSSDGLPATTWIEDVPNL